MIGEAHVTAPDVIEPLIGYRRFTLRYDPLNDIAYLSSPYMGDSWMSTDKEAFCDVHRNQAPVKDCRCGIYAYFEPCSPTDTNEIIALVTLWGTVEVHETGMRGQYAKICALSGKERADRSVDGHHLYQVAENLKLPLVETSKLKNLASEFGKPITDEMKPVNRKARTKTILPRWLTFARLPLLWILMFLTGQPDSVIALLLAIAVTFFWSLTILLDAHESGDLKRFKHRLW